MTEDILYYTLGELLPPAHALALNVPLGTLSLIAHDSRLPYPRLVAEQQFTAAELSLLLPLLDSYPNFCPYEVMFASFYTGTITEVTVASSRKRLHDAMKKRGRWDAAMRPVRNVLSRNRLKLRAFNITVVSLLETGYVLMLLPGRKWERRNGHGF